MPTLAEAGFFFLFPFGSRGAPQRAQTQWGRKTRKKKKLKIFPCERDKGKVLMRAETESCSECERTAQKETQISHENSGMRRTLAPGSSGGENG